MIAAETGSLTGSDDKPLVRIDGVTKRFGDAPAARHRLRHDRRRRDHRPRRP